MVWKWTCLQIFFLLGGKLIWTIHNKEPHRGRWLRINYLLRRWMAQRAEQLHVHCQSVIPELSDYFDVPAEKFFVHPHPRFPAQYIPRRESINRLNQTYRLNISPDNQIFLIFGNIARYKRIGKVVDIFSRLSNKNELIIAGKVKKGNQKLFKRLNRKVKENKNIKIIGRFIPDERVPYFLNSADYLIFNHYKLIASGAIELAFSYDKPVLAPRKGCLKEQFNHPKVHLFESQEELENLMQKLAGIQS